MSPKKRYVHFALISNRNCSSTFQIYSIKRTSRTGLTLSTSDSLCQCHLNSTLARTSGRSLDTFKKHCPFWYLRALDMKVCPLFSVQSVKAENNLQNFNLRTRLCELLHAAAKSPRGKETREAIEEKAGWALRVTLDGLESRKISWHCRAPNQDSLVEKTVSYTHLLLLLILLLQSALQPLVEVWPAQLSLSLLSRKVFKECCCQQHVKPPNLEDQWLERSNSRRKAPPPSETTQANLSSERWNYGREMADNFAETGDFHVTFGFFCMP